MKSYVIYYSSCVGESEHETVLISLGLPKDELQTAIELSLQESHNAQEEEREFNRYKRTL